MKEGFATSLQMLRELEDANRQEASRVSTPSRIFAKPPSWGRPQINPCASCSCRSASRRSGDERSTSTLSLAIAQQPYAFARGLVYVWLMEKSDGLLAPIVAHGVGNFVEVGSVMLLMAAAG
jgi:hypothetical protein